VAYYLHSELLFCHIAYNQVLFENSDDELFHYSYVRVQKVIKDVPRNAINKTPNGILCSSLSVPAVCLSIYNLK
jgi:hypothetical protein